MHTLTAVSMAIAGVYGYAAVHFALLWWMRRQSREYGSFAALCTFLALYTLASGVQFLAIDVAAGSRAEVHSVGWSALAIGAFTVFCVHVSGRESPRVVFAAHVVPGIAAAACFAGLFFDPAFPSESWTNGPTSPEMLPLPAFSLLGELLILASLFVGLFGLVELGRGALANRELRSTFAATCLPFIVGLWDLGTRSLGFALPALSSIAPLFAVIAIGWTLISRIARIEGELDERTGELARSYGELRRAQQELVRKEQLAAVGELSAVVAHEVRNPLAIIRNAVAGLRRAHHVDPTNEEMLLSILDGEADRLNRLVEDLLTYARPASIELREIDLHALLQRAIELAREGQSSRKDLTFELRTEEEAGTIHADAALLRHALINIVDNAIQAMPDGGTVSITCKPTMLDSGRRAVAIELHDEGEGMDTLVRSKAREAFFTTRQSGTGLGLAIVDRVAAVHGGRVEIESRHGHGTTVTLLLPVEAHSMPPPSTFA